MLGFGKRIPTIRNARLDRVLMIKQMGSDFWTNPSVLALARERDPLQAITEDARNLVFRALEQGWQGPPFDPFALADLLGLETSPNSEVLEARTVPLEGNRYRIEFNPDRPHRRLRYSIFHEIAHTLFPDCANMIRNRGVHAGRRPDDWQLEALCNVAAAEFLLPIGGLGDAQNVTPSIDLVLELRMRYEASAEAALLRICRLTSQQSLAFACHRDHDSGRYVAEYGVSTGVARWDLRPGTVLPHRTAVSECTAIGYTAKRAEHWPRFGDVRLECVGVAPLPGDIYPRVIGFVLPSVAEPMAEIPLTYLRGDATKPRGDGPKIVVHVVNDGAFRWGSRGFAGAIKSRWPVAQTTFTDLVTRDRTKLKLGNVISCEVEPSTTLASLVAQHGFGLSKSPRIRYGALRECLLRVSEMASTASASVHMPRIGTGQAGGSWPVIEEIICETLTKCGINVFVYDLPQGMERLKAQGDLLFAR